MDQYTFTVRNSPISVYSDVIVSVDHTDSTSGKANPYLQILETAHIALATSDLEGGYLMKRIIRDQTEEFYILVCRLIFQEPIADMVVTTPTTFAVPSASDGTAYYGITLKSIMYEPSDYGSSSVSCPTFTADVLLDYDRTRTSFSAIDSTHSEVRFDVTPTDLARERTFEHKAVIDTDEWNFTMSETFPVYICKIPTWSASPFEAYYDYSTRIF